MPVSDELDLEFYLTRRGQYQQSTFGPMLERASIAGVDSEGKKIPAHQGNAFWRPDGGDEILEPHGLTRNEPSYTPNVADFHRFGKVSRRLGFVRTRSALLHRALEAYYGDSGSRWREAALTSEGDEGEVRHGYGPGQIVSLYALTQSGRALLQREAAKLQAANHRTGDEILEAALLSLARKPGGQGKKVLDTIRREADALLLQARSAYLTACAIDDPRRRPKIATKRPKAKVVHFRSRIASEPNA